jgi:hypothetical protein
VKLQGEGGVGVLGNNLEIIGHTWVAFENGGFELGSVNIF